MDYRVDTNAETNGEEVTYLYSFQQGRSTSSYGTRCAAMSGIAPKIIERAEELIVLSAKGEDLVAACAQLSSSELEDLREAEMIAREFLATEVDEHAREILDQLLKDVPQRHTLSRGTSTSMLI